MDIKEKIKNLPGSPGVYIMKDEKGLVLYVGKAGNLRKRVSSYFYPARNLGERIRSMVGKISDISYISSSTEAEALIYENSLIKQLSPKYNVALRDDKSYPMLKLTVNEKYPRLFITRQKADDGSVYYGPFADVKLLREAVVILRQLFPLRTCAKMHKSPCLDYHIKQCFAPCAGKIDEKDYSEIVSELKLFLEGRRQELLKALSVRMAEASRKENFEEAEKIRKRIEALGSIKKSSVDYSPLSELDELAEVLGIEKRPDVIEAFDVSNIMGSDPVGSMISFYKARPRKGEYRKFKIKTVESIDDYSMMREIIRRRYRRIIEEKKALPDLIVIDGGKGHLAVGLDELAKLGLSYIPAIGIAKEFEHIYCKDRKDPIVLPEESKSLHLLKRIRDEAHRFAISFHKSLRSKKTVLSELDKIPGIGQKRKRVLLSSFGSVEHIKKASLEDILKVEGIDGKTAKNIIGYFKKPAT